MTDVQKRNIEQLRLQGVGYKRIAGSLGISANTVKSYCQRNKLEAALVVEEVVTESAAIRHTACAGCGAIFASYGSKNRKYCGHSCYISSRFKKGGHRP